MQIAISDAKAKLSELAARAEAGEEVVLTRHGRPAIRLVSVQKQQLSADERWALLQTLRGSAKHSVGPDAAHAADYLYDDFGLPA